MHRLSLAGILAFLLVVPLTGCSLFDDASPPPTPAVVATPEDPFEPVPPAPDPPGTVYPMSWVPGEGLTVLDGSEPRLPHAEVVPQGEAVWRLYVVEDDGPPRLLHESGRWLRAPSWSADGGMMVPYFTWVEGAGHVFGYSRLDLASGSLQWDFKTERSVYPSPDGSRFLVNDQSGAIPPFLRGVYRVTDPAGESLALEGFASESFRGWSPDGRYFVSTGYARPDFDSREQSREYYLLEPGGSEVVLLGRAPQGSGLNVAWSPDSSKLTFTEGTNLIVFDVATRDRISIPLGVETRSEPSWTADGRYVAIADGAVDVAARSVVIPPRGEYALASALSPDGALLVRTTDILRQCVEPAGRQGNRTWLTDAASGQETTLFDCADGVHVWLSWLASGRLLVWSPACYACESGSNWIKLVRFPEQDVQNLTDEREAGADAVVSPDGSRVLVSGSWLRVYSASGAFLRVIEPAPGRRVSGISWSPDGSSFAYVVGPSQINLPP